MRGSVGNSGNQGGKRLSVFRLGVFLAAKICAPVSVRYNPPLLYEQSVQIAQEPPYFFWRFVIGVTRHSEYTPDILRIS